MLSDQTALRAAIRKELADFHSGRSSSFCIRTMVDDYHLSHGYLRGTVLAAILDEMETHSFSQTVLRAAE